MDSLQETLAKRMNDDLRKLSTWLRANKFSLNVKKTTTCVSKIKCKIVMKYLGVLSDETSQASKVTKQTFIYSKQYTILSLELIFLMPASCGVKTTEIHKIKFQLSKTDLSKIAFKNRYKSGDPLYKNLKNVKFQGNYLFMCQLDQSKRLAGW